MLDARRQVGRVRRKLQGRSPTQMASNLHSPFRMLAGETYLRALSVNPHAANVGLQPTSGQVCGETERGDTFQRGHRCAAMPGRGAPTSFPSLTVIGGEVTQVLPVFPQRRQSLSEVEECAVAVKADWVGRFDRDGRVGRAAGDPGLIHVEQEVPDARV